MIRLSLVLTEVGRQKESRGQIADFVLAKWGYLCTVYITFCFLSFLPHISKFSYPGRQV